MFYNSFISFQCRKEIAKEKRALLSRIRKKYLKNVKSVDTKCAFDDKTTAVLTAVAEIETQGNHST